MTRYSSLEFMEWMLFLKNKSQMSLSFLVIWKHFQFQIFIDQWDICIPDLLEKVTCEFLVPFLDLAFLSIEGSPFFPFFFLRPIHQCNSKTCVSERHIGRESLMDRTGRGEKNWRLKTAKIYLWWRDSEIMEEVGGGEDCNLGGFSVLDYGMYGGARHDKDGGWCKLGFDSRTLCVLINCQVDFVCWVRMSVCMGFKAIYVTLASASRFDVLWHGWIGACT